MAARRTMTSLFSYFGAKWQHAPKYPAPEHAVIVEPFAGAAGYATAYYRRRVILVEKDPRIAALWAWLIRVKPEEIRRLPIFRAGERVSDAPGLCDEAKTFLGLRVGRGTQAPRDKVSPWGADVWTERAREIVALQVDLIRHWTILEGSYENAPDVEATWFIDPPYCKEGFRYPASSKGLDFTELGTWCRKRKGLVIACEQEGATWLPFVPFFQMNGSTQLAQRSDTAVGRKKSMEVVWVNRNIPCTSCAGRGELGGRPCADCAGKGRI